MFFINSRRACAARVTVVGSVCVSVCLSVSSVLSLASQAALSIMRVISCAWVNARFQSVHPCAINYAPARSARLVAIITSGMLSIFGERERPNMSAGCMSNAFRRRERNALPFSMVFVSASVHLLIYARTQ